MDIGPIHWYGYTMMNRDRAEQQVADQLGLPVAKVRAMVTAETEHAANLGVPVGRVGATWRLVQDAMQSG